MKLMVLGDIGSTGFGTVTQDLGKSLVALGHDLRFISQNAIVGALPEPFDGRTFVVTSPDGWMALPPERLLDLISGRVFDDGWRTEAVLIIGDIGTVRDIVFANEAFTRAFTEVPTFQYVPVEGVDLAPILKRLWDIVTPVAMTNFGANEIEKVTGKKPAMAYHGIDTDQFRPVTSERPLVMQTKDENGIITAEAILTSQADCKRFFGASPQAKLVLRTDRHMPRKGYNAWMRSLIPTLAHRRDAFAVIHAKCHDEGGVLYETISKFPEAIRGEWDPVMHGWHGGWSGGKFITTGFPCMTGADRNIMTALYNAADVYATNSSEGFGLTIAEATACGTPVVGVEYSAVPEVIGPAGVTVPVGLMTDNPYDHFWAWADERQFGEAVGNLLDHDILRKRLGKLGPTYVARNFSWNTAGLVFSGAIRDRLAPQAVEVAS